MSMSKSSGVKTSNILFLVLCGKIERETLEMNRDITFTLRESKNQNISEKPNSKLISNFNNIFYGSIIGSIYESCISSLSIGKADGPYSLICLLSTY